MAPHWIVRLLAVVSQVSGERGRWIFKKMPLRVVYIYEHIFYLREGYKVRKPRESLEDLMKGL